MRFYNSRYGSKVTVQDTVKSIIFIALFIVGISLCPRGDIYTIGAADIEKYSIGFFLSSMCMIYFFISLTEELNPNLIIRIAAALILISCSIVAIILITRGGLNIIAGVSIFCGIVIGAVLVRIV